MSQVIHATIQKWGNGLGLRVGGLMREIPKMEVGMPVDVEIFEDGFTVKKAVKSKRLFPFTEAELLKGLTPEGVHSDLLGSVSDREFGEW